MGPASPIRTISDQECAPSAYSICGTCRTSDSLAFAPQRLLTLYVITLLPQPDVTPSSSVCSIRYEQLGSEGYHSLFRWYQQFETAHFGDPYGVRGLLSKATLGLYPRAIKWGMAAFDLPEVVAISRGRICSAGLSSLTRVETLGFYLGCLAYLWLLAAPICTLVLGVYLYVSVGFLGVHYDEGFSSLRVKHFKGFLRMKITDKGEMEVTGRTPAGRSLQHGDARRAERDPRALDCARSQNV